MNFLYRWKCEKPPAPYMSARETDGAQHADLRLSELARSAIVVKKANRELHVEANDFGRTLVRPPRSECRQFETGAK